MIQILSIFANIDFNPVHFAAELRPSSWIIIGHTRTKVIAYVTGLVGGEDERLRLIDTPFAGLLPVHVQCDRSALRQPAAVVPIDAWL